VGVQLGTTRVRVGRAVGMEVRHICLRRERLGRCEARRKVRRDPPQRCERGAARRGGGGGGGGGGRGLERAREGGAEARSILRGEVFRAAREREARNLFDQRLV
jgi:hypothetical protein